MLFTSGHHFIQAHKIDVVPFVLISLFSGIDSCGDHIIHLKRNKFEVMDEMNSPGEIKHFFIHTGLNFGFLPCYTCLKKSS